jgi:hypothetical protein
MYLGKIKCVNSINFNNFDKVGKFVSHNTPKKIPSSIKVSDTYVIYKSIKRVNVLICNEHFPLGRYVVIVIF